MDYSQHLMGLISDQLSYINSSLYDGMRQENINAGWIENSSPHNYFSCIYCGESHFYEHCPYSTTSYSVRDEFTIDQTYFDYSICSSESFEQQESLNPYLSHFSQVITPSFHSYPHSQENILECNEKSTLERILEEFAESSERFCREQKELATRIESRVQNIGVHVNQIVSSLETVNQENSLNMVSISCIDDDYCEEIENVELNETLSLVEYDSKIKITLGENNVCSLEGGLVVEPNSCHFDVEIDLDVPRVVVHDSPIEVLTLTDESQVDFVGCFIFLKVHNDVINLNLVNSCTLKLFTIEEVQVIKLNDHLLCLKPCCLKRNEKKVIMVFDTFD